MPDRPPISIPARSAIFPLPDSILFPHTLLPVFVYEPHYRLMLEDCLKGDRLMSVVLLRKGSPKSLLDAPAYSVAGLGRVTSVMRLPESTFRIFLGGIARVSIRRYTQHRPYPIAEIELLESRASEPSRLDAARARVLRLFREFAGASGGDARRFLDRIEEINDPEIVSHLVAAGLDVDPHAKQRLLETVDVGERLDRLGGLLERRIEHARIIGRIMARAPRDVRNN